MSSYTSVSSQSVDAQVQHSRDLADSLSLNTLHLSNSQFDPNLLSPYNQNRTISNSTSPYNISNTPVESISDYSNFGSDYSEFEDEFLGVNFDVGVQRIDSLPTTFNDALQELSTNIASQKPSEAATVTTYPISPRNTSIPNTPSPRSEVNDSKTRTIITNHEIEIENETHNSGYTFPALTSTLNTLQLTPDNSGSSHTSAEGVEPASMAFHAHSPHVTVSHWVDESTAELTTFSMGGSQFGERIASGFSDYHYPSQMQQSPQTTALRDDEGMWRTNDSTGLAGLGPEDRKLMSDIEVPNLKEQEEQRNIDHRNIQVQMWRDRGNEISDPNEPRSRYSYFEAQKDNGDIEPVDDAASIRNNKLLDGQVYFNLKGMPATEIDEELMSQPRHFNDAPALPYMTLTSFQPPTANEAIQKWNGNADTFSITSRAATWGTRRKSEPSLMDYEAVADGSFLKKLSIKQEKKGQNSNLAGRLAERLRKRSISNLKRGRSSSNLAMEVSNEPTPNNPSSLAPPPRTSSFGKKPTPSLNTAFAAMTGPLTTIGTGQHTRNGSLSASSPKSPLHLGLPSVWKNRVRSKSEANQKSIVDLWTKQGGPPVPNLSSSAVNMPSSAVEAEDEDEDEDDEHGDEGDMRVEPVQTEPIIPTYEGFKDHVRRLNPDMDPKYSWLVSRIAHQQEIRYKNLLDLRVKHMQSTMNHNCAARPHCLVLGGSATLYDAKGKPRDTERSAGGLQLVTDFSDDSNPGEGALSSESFPKGVPMPPTRNLPAEFECQLCFKAKRFQKPSDWTKHVHEDVQPFCCTYDKCRDPKSFKRKADWVRHENERHRHLEWWICQMDDCKHPCYRKDNFLQHLVREHKLPEPKQKTKAAIKKARLTEPAWVMLEKCHHETTTKPQDEPCKFCGKSFTSWKKLTVHLAKHMEHISLPVLRLVEQKHVNADTIISPVEQNLTPITPIKTKLEDLSPFMDTVSPNVSMMPPFTNGFHQPTAYSTSGPSPTYGMQAPMTQNDQYPMFTSTFNVQPMNQQPRQFTMESGNLAAMRTFGSIDPGFTQNQIDQSRGFGSIDSSFSHMPPSQAFNSLQATDFSMTQPFVTASPSVAAYQTPSMMGIADTANFGFDGLPVAQMPNFQQVPMSRAHGSSSSYGHSPQNMQHSPQNMQYYGQQ